MACWVWVSDGEFSPQVGILLCVPPFAGVTMILLGLFMFVVMVVIVLVVLAMKLILRQRLHCLD